MPRVETPEKSDGAMSLGGGGWEATSPRTSVKHQNSHLGWWLAKNVTPAASCMSKMEFPLPSPQPSHADLERGKAKLSLWKNALLCEHSTSINYSAVTFEV